MKYIYLRKNLANGKCYIGQTKNMTNRNYDWKHQKVYGNHVLSADRYVYGFDNFETSILKECDDSEGDKWEDYYIKQYNTIFPNGYNIKNGGTSGWHHAEKSRHKMSEARKELYKVNKPYWYGRIRSDCDKEKMSTSHMKQVYQYTLDGELVAIWKSTLECASNGFNQGHVAACCRGAEKKHKGYKWSYVPL